MPDLQTELAEKVVDIVVPSLPSVREYVLNAIIDEPGITGSRLAADKPEHIATPSIPSQVNQLFNMGVLRREPRKAPTGHTTYAYWIEDNGLDKLPPEQSGTFRPRPRKVESVEPPAATATNAWTLGEYIISYFLRNPDAPSYQLHQNAPPNLSKTNLGSRVRDLVEEGMLEAGAKVSRPGMGGKPSRRYTVKRVGPDMKAKLLRRDPSLADYIDVIERKALAPKPPIIQAPEPKPMNLPVDDAYIGAVLAAIEPAGTTAVELPPARKDPPVEQKHEPGIRIAIQTERKQYVMRVAEARAVYEQLHGLFGD